jgi:hypothetical protein
LIKVFFASSMLNGAGEGNRTLVIIQLLGNDLTVWSRELCDFPPNGDHGLTVRFTGAIPSRYTGAFFERRNESCLLLQVYRAAKKIAAESEHFRKSLRTNVYVLTTQYSG